MDGKTCVEKQKTMTARRTLDPLYQQQLCFTMPYNGKILQVRHVVSLFLLPTSVKRLVTAVKGLCRGYLSAKP